MSKIKIVFYLVVVFIVYKGFVAIKNFEIGVDIHFNDRLGKLKVSDEGIRSRDEIVIENFFSKNIPLCGVLGGGYNKDFNKLVELHSYLHQSCAKLL